MKTTVSTSLILAIVAVAAAPLSAVAADEHKHGHNHHAAMSKPAAEKAAPIDGVVKRVDKDAKKLTISHGPLPNGMPAMTMTMGVKEAAWLDNVKSGDKVRFRAEGAMGAMTIVQLDPIK